jgi:hypothetical protein
MSGRQSLRSSNSQDETQTSGSGESGGGSYTSDFPDSTKGTAVISPSDPAQHPLFLFDTTMNSDFPDMSDREFLKPSLHVGGGGGSSGSNEKQDVYQRIEERLRSYREAAEKGSKQGKGGSGAMGIGRASKKTSDAGGLKKKSSTTSKFSY